MKYEIVVFEDRVRKRPLDFVNDEKLRLAKIFVQKIIDKGEPWTDPDFPP